MARGTRMVNIYMSFYVLLTMLVSYIIYLSTNIRTRHQGEALSVQFRIT